MSERRLRFTTTRDYVFDPERLTSTFDKEWAAARADGRSLDSFLIESVGELTGWGRDDSDHIDGSYVQLEHDDSETDLDP